MEGAQLVCLQELTLSPYFAIVPDALETAAVPFLRTRRPETYAALLDALEPAG